MIPADPRPSVVARCLCSLPGRRRMPSSSTRPHGCFTPVSPKPQIDTISTHAHPHLTCLHTNALSGPSPGTRCTDRPLDQLPSHCHAVFFQPIPPDPGHRNEQPLRRSDRCCYQQRPPHRTERCTGMDWFGIAAHAAGHRSPSVNKPPR